MANVWTTYAPALTGAIKTKLIERSIFAQSLQYAGAVIPNNGSVVVGRANPTLNTYSGPITAPIGNTAVGASLSVIGPKYAEVYGDILAPLNVAQQMAQLDAAIDAYAVSVDTALTAAIIAATGGANYSAADFGYTAGSVYIQTTKNAAAEQASIVDVLDKVAAYFSAAAVPLNRVSVAIPAALLGIFNVGTKDYRSDLEKANSNVTGMLGSYLGMKIYQPSGLTYNTTTATGHIVAWSEDAGVWGESASHGVIDVIENHPQLIGGDKTLARVTLAAGVGLFASGDRTVDVTFTLTAPTVTP